VLYIYGAPQFENNNWVGNDVILIVAAVMTAQSHLMQHKSVLRPSTAIATLIIDIWQVVMKHCCVMHVATRRGRRLLAMTVCFLIALLGTGRDLYTC
jgi:heme/copper-type cytochrome/quinol oxidase subunit 4